MSGRIPQSFIDDLMTRVDIVEVIDARVPLKKAGREYTARCPFHDEKTPSFTVSPSKQFYHCFGCGAHGTAIGFLMDYEHMEFPEAVEDLARGVGMQVPREAGSPAAARVEKSGPDLYAVIDSADRWFRAQLRRHPAAGRAVDYLKQRGLSGEIAAEFGIGFAPPGFDNLLGTVDGEDERAALVSAGLAVRKDNGGLYDRFRDRVMFPIRDRRGRTIAFGGRVLEGGSNTGKGAGPKYLNSPETPLFHKGRELYGLYEARKALRDIPRLLVVEGYMDVISLAQYGIRYAVATLGTATTPEHLERLFRVSPEVVFCFDGDRAGRDAAWRALENALPVVREGRQIRFMFLPQGDDPDTRVRAIGAAAFEAEIVKARAFSEFLFERLLESADTASIDGRARLVELARPLLRRLSPGVYRQMMVARLAELARLETSQAEAALGGAPSAPPAPRRRVAAPPRGSRQPPSLVRRAIVLLLQEPRLATRVQQSERYAGLDLPGIPLFMEVLELLHQRPHLGSGALLEHWRGTEHGQHLSQLARQERLISEEQDLAVEFDGLLARLDQYARQCRYDELLQQLESRGLSDAEREEFRQLQRRVQAHSAS